MKTVLAIVLVLAVPAYGQTQTAKGSGVRRITSTPQAAYNPTAKDTTPLNCENYARNAPMKPICEDLEAGHIKSEARRVGRPGPSTSVIDLPPLGSAEAKRTGLSCVGGQAMRKIAGGWEQVQGVDGWQRCRGG